MARLPAFAVNGGRVPAEMLRRSLWATSHGANGVVGIHDLRVNPLPTPGPGVSIRRGAALATMRSSGANSQETYLLAQDSETHLPISSGPTQYIIARIDDWHFTGEDAPDDPLNALYWSFETVSTLSGIAYPHVPLASVTVPAGVVNVQRSHITDLRKVAMPRTERRLFARNLSASEGIQELIVSQPSEQYWPAESSQPWTIDIPEWATEANVVASWNGILVRPHSNKHGVVWARIGRPDGWGQGNTETQHQKWDLGGSATGREHWELADDIPIPSALRGTTQPLRLLGMRLEEISDAGPQLDSGSAIKFDVEFRETARVDIQGSMH